MSEASLVALGGSGSRRVTVREGEGDGGGYNNELQTRRRDCKTSDFRLSRERDSETQLFLVHLLVLALAKEGPYGGWEGKKVSTTRC